MPVQQFNFRKPINGMAPGVKPVSQAWGEKVYATDRVGSAGDRDNIKPAGLYSTAPYVDPDGVSHHSPLIVKTTQCVVITNKGTRCLRTVKEGSDLCAWHLGMLKKE